MAFNPNAIWGQIYLKGGSLSRFWVQAEIWKGGPHLVSEEDAQDKVDNLWPECKESDLIGNNWVSGERGGAERVSLFSFPDARLGLILHPEALDNFQRLLRKLHLHAWQKANLQWQKSSQKQDSLTEESALHKTNETPFQTSIWLSTSVTPGNIKHRTTWVRRLIKRQVWSEPNSI